MEECFLAVCSHKPGTALSVDQHENELHMNCIVVGIITSASVFKN